MLSNEKDSLHRTGHWSIFRKVCGCSLGMEARPQLLSLLGVNSHPEGLRSLGAGTRNSLLDQPYLSPSASQAAASLMTTLFCFSGHLLPTGAAGPQDKGLPDPRASSAFGWSRWRPGQLGLRDRKSKQLTSRQAGPWGSQARCV